MLGAGSEHEHDAYEPRPVIPLEIAVGTAHDATIALASGATRVELCAALELGGVTPSIAQIEATVATGVPVSVLVRVRPGDFVYSEPEKNVMLRDAARALEAGAAGIVIGALTEQSGLDLDFVKRMADVAASSNPRAEVTFHRALDHCSDPVGAVAQLAVLGITRMLTSGGALTARAGIDTIRAIAAVSPRPELMAGGGVAVADIRSLLEAGANAIHLSAKRTIRSHAGGVALGVQDAGSYFAVDPEIVQAARDELDR